MSSPELYQCTYDQVPYESRPMYPTHPDCLATVAALMGLEPPPAQACRVLEIGCATGGNLTPMAASLPESRFVGIDLSPRQIEEGRATINAVGLSNIELHAMDLMDFGPQFGLFDYIICHGVYSWTPSPVQHRILEIARQHLSPQGVAYVSYNTYPGWFLRQSVRSMMQYYVRRFSEPADQIRNARKFLEFLSRAVAVKDDTYARMLEDEKKQLNDTGDAYLFHEHLEADNHPVYFHEFAERAASHGLQYLGEAWQFDRLEQYPADVQDALRSVASSLIDLEQFLDFLGSRTFRRTLLCHAELTLSRAPRHEVVMGMSVCPLARPVSAQPNVRSEEVERFLGPYGNTATTNSPFVKAMLWVIHQRWPKPLTVPELAQRMDPLLAGLDDFPSPLSAEGEQLLVYSLLRAFACQLVLLRLYPTPYAEEPGPLPCAPPLVRYQATRGTMVSNLRHRTIPLEPEACVMIPYLDGTRDRGWLTTQFEDERRRGTIAVAGDAGKLVDQLLNELAFSALLVA